MRFIFIYKGIYVGILLINFYIYHILHRGYYTGLSESLAHYFLWAQAFYFTWNAFNFSRIWQKKVTRIVLISEMVICVGKMVMPIAGIFFTNILARRELYI